MLFNSLGFILFFPIVVFIYFCLPQKVKNYWLLVASYYFYMCWNAKYALLLLASTVVTFLLALMISRLDAKWKNVLVAVGVIINLGILAVFKYAGFMIESLELLLSKLHIAVFHVNFDVLLPVGISFYIFQALGYLIDVSRGETAPEKNFFRYALYVSFFPQLVAGPIERSRNLLPQFYEKHGWNDNRVKEGLLLMLWGYFQKLVIADRVSTVVDTVYFDHWTYGGFYAIVATVLFAVQIYCDFAGYSNIAIGAANVMGFRLMENFNCPYFSRSVSEFWRRWHISLSSWFKDYLYIPLGGNRKGKLWKNLNLMIVFLASGLWHGANWTYVVWGGVNGLYQVLGGVCKPVRDRMNRLLRNDETSLGHKIFQVIITFILIDFAWVFFRAGTIMRALGIVKTMLLARNPWVLWDGSLYTLGLDQKNFTLAIFAILILAVADVAKYKGMCIRKTILQQEWWIRWICIIVSIMFVLIFGVWGSAYSAKSFIYFQF